MVAQPDDDDPAVLAMLAQMTPVERQNWEAMLARAENDEVEEEELQEDAEEEEEAARIRGLDHDIDVFIHGLLSRNAGGADALEEEPFLFEGLIANGGEGYV